MDPIPIPEALLDRLRSGRRFLVTSHQNPDGDAVGTSIALARLLRGRGASARVWLRDPVPEIFRPAVGTTDAGVDGHGELLHTGEAAPEGFPGSVDTVVVLECPALDRSGLAVELGGLPLLNIDHHLGNELYGAVDWVDSDAPAVGEMVLQLAIALDLSIDAASANALFLALATDTGGFRFANATVRAFVAGAELVRRGARPEEVSRWLYESRSEGAVRLVAEALSTLRRSAGGRVATIAVTGDMYDRSGAVRSDTEGLIDFPRSIHGVDAVALVRELPQGGHKVSVRSRGPIDVESVARRHGGGGHRNAAGFGLAGTDLEAARTLVEDELGDLLGGDSGS